MNTKRKPNQNNGRYRMNEHDELLQKLDAMAEKQEFIYQLVLRDVAQTRALRNQVLELYRIVTGNEPRSEKLEEVALEVAVDYLDEIARTFFNK